MKGNKHLMCIFPYEHAGYGGFWARHFLSYYPFRNLTKKNYRE